MRLAFVVQRYGPDVHGGAEQLCRAWAERLAARHTVAVFTTRARDYLTWADHYPAGEMLCAGVRVRRYGVDQPRDMAAFEALSQRVLGGAGGAEAELEWMRRQGPYSTPLLEAIAAARDDYDLFIFMTYLYCTSFFGLPLVSAKAVLVPTAHDEPPLRLGLFRQLFARPRALLFLMPAERALVRRRFAVEHIPAYEVPVGLDLPEAAPPAAAAEPPLLLYIGRVHPSKAVDELLAHFTRYRAATGRAVRLAFAGRLDAPLPAHPDVSYLGYVDEGAKAALLAQASVVLMPSYYESLSISVLEAWAAGRPTLVNGRSAVLREQTVRGGGGLYYQSYAEFAACLDLLLDDAALRRRMAARGRAFVAQNYAWPVAAPRLEAALATILRKDLR